jgi:hypothetical protein
MIEVLKVTATSGRQYFSKRHDVVDMMERVPDWKKIERVNMTEKEYQAIPATNDSAKIFR